MLFRATFGSFSCTHIFILVVDPSLSVMAFFNMKKVVLKSSNFSLNNEKVNGKVNC